MMKITALFMSLMLASLAVQANFLNDLSTAIGGHLSDLQSRFMDDQIIEGKTIAETKFRDNDPGQDALHHGSGTVSIIETAEGRFLQLGSDFSSTPGPDYHVYISQDTNVNTEERFVQANQTELGRLIKGSGASYYKIPDNTEFQSVTIWCKAFDEFIVSADFES